MKFAGTDLRTTYGLIVRSVSGWNGMPPITNPHDVIVDYGINFVSQLQPKVISLSVLVEAATESALKTALDNISLLLNPQLGAQALYLDWPNYNRYYTAKLQSISPWEIFSTIARADIEFFCADPLAYSDTETHSDYDISGSDPKTETETPGGSAIIRDARFVISNPDSGDITLENTTTGDSITVTSDGTDITIDSGEFTCAGATAFSGHFPRLLPGQANSITITGAGTGSNQGLDIYYRDAYL